MVPQSDDATEGPPVRHGTLRNILLNAGWMLGGKGLSGVLSTLYLAIATRSLGVEGFGQFALVLGLGQGVAGFASFQSWQIVVRYGMQHIHAGRDAALTRLVRFSALLDIASGVAAALLVSAGIMLIGPRLGWSRDFLWQALASCVVLVLAVQSTPIGVLRLHDRFGDATLAEAFTPITRFIGAVIVWLTHPSVIAFLVVWSASEVITAAAYWLLAARQQRIEWRGGDWLRLRAVAEENGGILRYAVTTNLTSSLGLGAKQLAVLLVGLMVTPAAAGGYRVAQQLSQALGKLSQTLSRAIFPELMRSHAGDDEGGDFDRLFDRTRRLAMIGGGAVIVLLLTVGRPVLGLVAGKAFLPVYPVLLVLGIAAALDFAGVGFEPALVARGRAGTALELRFVSTATMLALMLALTPRHGGIGAAFAVLVSSILSFAMLWRAVQRA